ncbi:MAG: hypothetical protein ACI8RZ_007706 [Myxococcota bacterium]|jgi:hypothetical protein
MRSLVRVPSVVLMGMLSLSAWAALEGQDDLGDALSGDADAVAALRGGGESGLTRVMSAYAEQVTPKTEAEWRALIDAVAAQRDAATSGLYWYTDLDEAKAIAEQTGRPILSLRLLGALTDEYSCANSRFFRAALYSNPDLAALIAERYVLHWSTERPVPVVTIDFGDGRSMKRTLTGNSAHYILDARGRPIDVLPGMVGPGVFAEQLTEAADLHASLADLSSRKRTVALTQWHEDARQEAVEALQAGIEAAGREVASGELEGWLAGGTPVDGPIAVQAMALSPSKGFVETPILERIIPRRDPLDRGSIAPTDAEWSHIAQGFSDASHLHHASRQLIIDQRPLAVIPPDLQDHNRLFEQLEQSISEDSARNELSLHAQIHGWFAAGEVKDFEGLNRRVYDDLFATPASDPWMGLLEADVYTGLSEAGIIIAQ